MLNDFYGAFGAVSFTLLGLWFVVVQTRHAEWSRSPEHQRRASAVSLHFALPGLMSLLALVDPESRLLWRLSFAVTAVVGAAALAMLARSSEPAADGTARKLASWLSVGGYVLVAAVALFPQLPAELGLRMAPIRVEAVLLSLLVFLGVNRAWLAMFEPMVDQAPPPEGPGR